MSWLFGSSEHTQLRADIGPLDADFALGKNLLTEDEKEVLNKALDKLLTSSLSLDRLKEIKESLDHQNCLREQMEELDLSLDNGLLEDNLKSDSDLLSKVSLKQMLLSAYPNDPEKAKEELDRLLTRTSFDRWVEEMNQIKREEKEQKEKPCRRLVDQIRQKMGSDWISELLQNGMIHPESRSNLLSDLESATVESLVGLGTDRLRDILLDANAYIQSKEESQQRKDDLTKIARRGLVGNRINRFQNSQPKVLPKKIIQTRPVSIPEQFVEKMSQIHQKKEDNLIQVRETYPNGTVRLNGSRNLEGQPVGLWTIWDESGHKIKETYYDPEHAPPPPPPPPRRPPTPPPLPDYNLCLPLMSSEEYLMWKEDQGTSESIYNLIRRSLPTIPESESDEDDYSDDFELESQN